MEKTITLRDRMGADGIYIIDRRGENMILPVRTVKNIVPSRSPYPSSYDIVISAPILEEEFIPGLQKYMSSVNKEELEKVIGLLFHNISDTGNWHGRRAREYQGNISIDGKDFRNPHIGSESAGKINKKIKDIHSLQQLLYL